MAVRVSPTRWPATVILLAARPPHHTSGGPFWEAGRGKHLAADGLDRTIDVLARSENQAAHFLLLELFLRGDPDRREQVLDILLTRPHREILRELVARFHELDPKFQRRILSEGTRLENAVRQAYVEADPVIYANARELIRRLPDYDQSSLLIGSLVGKDDARRKDAVALLANLTDELLRESALPEQERSQHDMEAVRRRYLTALRQGMRRFPQHREDIVLTSFLRLAEDEAPEVLQIAREDSDPCHRSLTTILRRSTDPRVLRWVYRLLNTPHPPPAILAILGERDDQEFVEKLLDQVTALVETPVAQSLRRVNEIRWLEAEPPLVARLSEDRQAAAVIFAIHSGVRLEVKLRLIAYLLDEGSTKARRAAACALAQLPGSDANQLVVACLDDEDPEVQLAVTPFLRERGLPNVMALLVKQLDRPDERIREAARSSLSDYTMERFLGSYDQMEDPTRKPLGAMILRIDGAARQTLAKGLATPQRQHRIRAARVIRQLGLAGDLIEPLVALLSDADKLVRREAIEALSPLPPDGVVERLVALASDPAPAGQAGAAEAIEHLRREARHPALRLALQQAAQRLGLPS